MQKVWLQSGGSSHEASLVLFILLDLLFPSHVFAHGFLLGVSNAYEKLI